jgi:hypothetical protein
MFTIRKSVNVLGGLHTYSLSQRSSKNLALLHDRFTLFPYYFLPASISSLSDIVNHSLHLPDI